MLSIQLDRYASWGATEKGHRHFSLNDAAGVLRGRAGHVSRWIRCLSAIHHTIQCFMTSHRPLSPTPISSENATASRLTLAIVDDHPPICQALREAADERIGMHVVGEAGSKLSDRKSVV